MIVLRPYQAAGVHEAYRLWGTGARSVLLVAPTGAGKGSIAAHVMQREAGPCIFLVHRREILADVAQRLLKSGVTDLAVRMGGRLEGSPTARVQVCGVQTLVASGERPPAELVVWDEGHHAVASTYRAIRDAYPNARHLGLTATPERGDRTALGDVFDALHVVASVRQLTESGYLVPIDTVAPTRAVQDLAADPLQAYEQHALGRPAVFFCARRAHAHELASTLTLSGTRAACITGDMHPEARRKALTAFARGELAALTNVDVLTEGWDCPRAEVCVLGRGVTSAAAFLQMCGRVLRPSEGKARALLLDLKGVVHAFGLPDDERVFSLEGRAIRQAEDAIQVRQCGECGACFRPVPACPRCGAVAPAPEAPKVKETKLVKAPPLVAMHVKRGAFDAMCARAAALGHAPVSIGIKFKGIYGHWPPWPVPGLRRAANVSA